MKNEELLLIFALAQKSSAIIHYALFIVQYSLFSLPGSRPESVDDGHSFIFSPAGEIQTVGERYRIDNFFEGDINYDKT